MGWIAALLDILNRLQEQEPLHHNALIRVARVLLGPVLDGARPFDRAGILLAERNAQASEGLAAFDRIAIFLRSTGEYRPHLEEAFRRAAIPAYFARGTTRPDPAGRALLALLACRSEDFSARRFAEYTSLSQVPDPESARDPEANWTAPPPDVLPLGVEPESPTDEESETEPRAADLESIAEIAGTLRAPWRWERLLVESSVIGGKDRWKKRIEGLENELHLKRKELIEEGEETRAAGLDQQIRDIEHLREFALPLIDELVALRTEEHQV